MYTFLKISILALVLGLSTQVELQAQQIIEEPVVASMMRSYVNYNKNVTNVRGWRIQLLATADRRQMESARQKFQRDYPEYRLIFNHEPPFFHLQTGAFLTKQTALPFLERMKKDYASAFLVADDIEVSEVLRYD